LLSVSTAWTVPVRPPCFFLFVALSRCLVSVVPRHHSFFVVAFYAFGDAFGNSARQSWCWTLIAIAWESSCDLLRLVSFDQSVLFFVHAALDGFPPPLFLTLCLLECPINLFWATGCFLNQDLSSCPRFLWPPFPSSLRVSDSGSVPILFFSSPVGFSIPFGVLVFLFLVLGLVQFSLHKD